VASRLYRKLRRAFDRSGHTYESLGAALGADKITAYRRVNLIGAIDLAMLRRLAKVLDVEITEADEIERASKRLGMSATLHAREAKAG